jgi:hypothetical protein
MALVVHTLVPYNFFLILKGKRFTNILKKVFRKELDLESA